jgi:hypothetical protein
MRELVGVDHRSEEPVVRVGATDASEPRTRKTLCDGDCESVSDPEVRVPVVD